jgi:hypothetical protein
VSQKVQLAVKATVRLEMEVQLAMMFQQPTQVQLATMASTT